MPKGEGRKRGGARVKPPPPLATEQTIKKMVAHKGEKYSDLTPEAEEERRLTSQSHSGGGQKAGQERKRERGHGSMGTRIWTVQSIWKLDCR